MNKYLACLSIATAFVFSAQTTANPFFEKLLPFTTKQAETWVAEHASALSEELQLTYLNLFAFHTPESIKMFIQCAQFIESNEEILPSYEAFGSSIMSIIKKYVEPIQRKMSTKKISEEEEQRIIEKLQVKIQELVAYINGIYYRTLYNQVAQNSAQAPSYMFDAQGVIQPEKRTRLLPTSL